jgi:adenylate kinase
MIRSGSSEEIFIFVGPPGSGKGSLASLCAERLGWNNLSTGNLCRKHIAEQTEIGKEIDFAIKSGKLVSDELISKMVEQWFVVEDAGQSVVILDGYPRTVKQAEIFDNLLKSSLENLKLHIVQLLVSDETVLQRLSSRLVCSNKECQAVYSAQAGSLCAPKVDNVCDICASKVVRRVDDDESAIHKRLQIYHQHTNNLLDFYHKMGYDIVKINVEKPLEMVFDDFMKTVGVASI